MDVKATLETRTSHKGKPYRVLVIKLTDTSEKLVFLSNAEIELINLYYKNNSSLEFPSLN